MTADGENVLSCSLFKEQWTQFHFWGTDKCRGFSCKAF